MQCCLKPCPTSVVTLSPLQGGERCHRKPSRAPGEEAAVLGAGFRVRVWPPPRGPSCATTVVPLGVRTPAWFPSPCIGGFLALWDPEAPKAHTVTATGEGSFAHPLHPGNTGLLFYRWGNGLRKVKGLPGSKPGYLNFIACVTMLEFQRQHS